MDIITSLGVDSTLGVQFVVFLVTYIFLNQLLFKPYLRAYEERKNRTVGNTEQATQIIEESEKLKEEYEAKARTLNDEYRKIYDQKKAEAQKEYDVLLSEAKNKSKAILENTRTEIKKEVEHAKEQLKSEAPLVTKQIVSKLIGKEVSA